MSRERSDDLFYDFRVYFTSSSSLRNKTRVLQGLACVEKINNLASTELWMIFIDTHLLSGFELIKGYNLFKVYNEGER